MSTTNVTPGSGKYERLLERCASLEPVATAVAHPCEASALAGPVEAARLGLIRPILVGPRAKIEEIAKSAGVDIASLVERVRFVDNEVNVAADALPVPTP